MASFNASAALSELIKFFWKRMHWKVGHTSHPHNQERSYGKLVNTQ